MQKTSLLDLHYEDTIIVRKAGEIIPEVIRVIKEFRTVDAKLVNFLKTAQNVIRS